MKSLEFSLHWIIKSAREREREKIVDKGKYVPFICGAVFAPLCPSDFKIIYFNAPTLLISSSSCGWMCTALILHRLHLFLNDFTFIEIGMFKELIDHLLIWREREKKNAHIITTTNSIFYFLRIGEIKSQFKMKINKKIRYTTVSSALAELGF